MVEEILKYERDLFFFLNGSDSSFLDHYMWLFSGKIVWLPLVLVILWILVYKKNWRESLLVLLAIALVVTFCDQFASSICKPLFARYRPTHHPDFKDAVDVVFGYRGGRYGFISSHAANAFGFATLMSLIFRNKFFSVSILVWATITAYTRIYLGVHFISDIVPGILSGIFFGYLTYWIYLKVRIKFFTSLNSKVSTIYSDKDKNTISYAIWGSMLLLLALTEPLVHLMGKV